MNDATITNWIYTTRSLSRFSPSFTARELVLEHHGVTHVALIQLVAEDTVSVTDLVAVVALEEVEEEANSSLRRSATFTF